MKYIVVLCGLLYIGGLALAQIEETPDTDLQEYFAASDNNYDKSIIYVFFNNDPCYSCAQAVSMIEQVYNRNFIDDYNLFLINYQNDQENDFITAYNLSQPLEVVLVRINDGAAFGYEKLKNLEDKISDPVSFDEYLVGQINGFLGNN